MINNTRCVEFIIIFDSGCVVELCVQLTIGSY